LKARILKKIFALVVFVTSTFSVYAQQYLSDTYGFSCYNFFDNTTVSKTISGTTTTSTSSSYAPGFFPDPGSSSTTSIVVSSVAANNLSYTVSNTRCLQSKNQSSPLSTYINFISPYLSNSTTSPTNNSADYTTYQNLNNNDWEWSFLYKCNLNTSTRPTSANTYIPIGGGVNSWRYWLSASTSTISTTTSGFFITQDNDGILRVYAQSGSGSPNSTGVLVASTFALTNGSTYCIKVQRLNTTGNIRWRLFVDLYTSTVTQAKSIQLPEALGDYYSVSLTYKYSVLEAENVSGSNGAFQWDELNMYTRYIQFVGVTSPTSGISPNPLYGGENAVLYGMQLFMRGNYELGPYLYFSHTDGGSGYVEGNFGTTNLYKTTSLQLSTANSNASLSSSISIYNNGNAQASSVDDSWVTSGNYDGTLSSPGYYFITAAINSSVSAPAGTITFTGISQVFDQASTSSNINNVVNTPGSTSTIVFGNVWDWIGQNTTDWNASGSQVNWKENGSNVTGTYPQTSTDYVRIGVIATTFTNQPVMNGSISIGQLEFGSTSNPITLTMGQKYTLTVSSGLKLDAGAVVNFTNPKTGVGNGSTISLSGNSTMASTSSINFPSTTNYITFNGTTTGSDTFTLLSDASGSASIGSIPSLVTISGTYVVQRYISGGNANSRGYRLISSPVYAGTTGGNNVISINYIQNYAILSGTSGSTNGFDLAGNPTIYLYRDDKAFTNSSFTGGNFWGISALNNSPTYYYTVAGGGTSGNFYIPVGNGVMFFYRGDRFENKFNKTNANYATAESQVFATSGTLNTGQITVKDWFTSTLSTLDCTAVSGNSAVVGFNLVGNPYPCNINWDTYNTTTSTTGIYAPNVSNKYYIYNPKNKNYATYIANSSGIGSYDPSTANIIPSGQGFFVKAANSSAQLIFNESAKTTSQVNTSYLLLNSLPSSASVPYFHLKLIQDTLNDDATLFMFKPTASTGYVESEDAEVFAGSGSVTLSSVSSDNKALAINTLPLPGLKQTTIPLKVYTAGSGLYTLNRMDIHNIPQLFDVWLMDAYKKDSLDIKHNTTYNFNVNKADTNSAGSKRFSVVIRQNPAYAYKLLGFSGVKVLQGAQLKWVTENEADYTSFSLERSNDNGVTYNAITSVQGNASATYTYLDTRPVTGVNLYRLKQTDINGTISYSKVVSLSYADLSNNIANNLNVYPNPASGMLNLSVAQQVQTDAASYEIKIINTSGLLVKEAVSQQPYWQGSVANLSPGTYVIEVINKTTQTPVGKTKFVKL
jgi:hypothetical protein